MKQRNITSIPLVALALAAITFLAVRAQAQTETVLFSFNGTNGAEPYPAMVFDSAGNLYGTTDLGGDISGCSGGGCGTVFKLSRNHSGQWKETVLHSFTLGRGGAYPEGAVVLDAAGNIYGTAQYEGDTTACVGGGCGVVYELTPTTGGNYKEIVLHTFTGGTDGGVPESGLIFDAAGNLYGTTFFGGNNSDCTGNNLPGCGVVFELSPMAGGGWQETVLYAFTGLDDGGFPAAGVVFDNAGNLYGTAKGAGAFDSGTVFELSPGSSGGWAENTIHAFAGNADGANPFGKLTFDAAGNLYGVTAQGGTGFLGTVFELSPSSGGSWTESILFDFSLSKIGFSPLDGVIFDSKDNLYGTTSGGGTSSHTLYDGLVYELSPSSSGTWTETILHDFGSSGDGDNPYGGLVFDKAGNLYGTTGGGGASKDGVVFKIVP